MLERLIYNKSIEFLGKRIASAQFGFQKEHSSLQQLLLSYNTIIESANNNLQSDFIYLDFVKAFDSVPHEEFGSVRGYVALATVLLN